MSILKNLQISRENAARSSALQALCALVAAVSLAAFMGVLTACAGNRTDSPAAAEKFAVSLANDRCEKEFGKRPFKTGRFPATRSDDRWLWGWLDAKAAEGYTAQVSFHADRTEPEAHVYATESEGYDMEAPNATPLNAPAPETGE